MIKRNEYLNQIKPLIGKNIIKVFTGVRRSGKSTLLNLIIEELIHENIKEENIILIDFDSIDALNFRDIYQVNDYIQNLTKNLEDKVSLF